MTDSWWNTNYPVRRLLKITPKAGESIIAGHPVYSYFDKDILVTLNKLREDYQDLELLHFNGDNATPTWSLVAREVTYDSETDLIAVVFNTIDEIDSANTDYYLYMANQNLSGFYQRPQYESAIYIITATPSNNSGLMFTRPTEDWDDGVSTKANARATLTFNGINVRLTIEKGPDKGILELKLDDEDPIYIDGYSSSTSEEVVYENNDLTKERHYLRLKVTGNKSPSSTGIGVKIVSAQYSKFVEASDEGEEFYSTTGPLSTIVGL